MLGSNRFIEKYLTAMILPSVLGYSLIDSFFLPILRFNTRTHFKLDFSLKPERFSIYVVLSVSQPEFLSRFRVARIGFPIPLVK